MTLEEAFYKLAAQGMRLIIERRLRASDQVASSLDEDTYPIKVTLQLVPGECYPSSAVGRDPLDAMLKLLNRLDTIKQCIPQMEALYPELTALPTVDMPTIVPGESEN